VRIVLRGRIALASVLLSLSGLAARGQAVEIDYSKIKWSSLSPKDTATRYAILYVDPTSGATQMVYSLAPNSTSPCHWHSANQGSVVADGTETVAYAGSAGVTLDVGGYSFVPARTAFRVSTGAARAIILVSLDGRFDIKLAPDEQCKSSMPGSSGAPRAFEIDFSNVQWTPFPSKESGVAISMLRVDSTSGTTHMLFRIPPNATSPCHWHTGSESNFIARGSAKMWHTRMVESGMLGRGGFGFMSAKMRHGIATGPSGALVFSVLDARFDFHAVAAEECR